MKMKQYNIGDMFIMFSGGLYRGVICEANTYDEYIIYWTHPNQTVKDVGYNRFEINVNIDHGNWKYYPVK